MPPVRYLAILALVIAAAGASLWIGRAVAGALGLSGTAGAAILPLVAVFVLGLRALAVMRR
ncbi:MAG: hypothetical protein KDK10_07025 [Maritimibacter sp.]|nr:hypothetical protein [Maritimibacter sp.]